MRTKPITEIVDLAMQTSLNISSQAMADLAIKHRFNHHDYRMLCKCRDIVPVTEMAYLVKVQEANQLELEGIV